MEIEIHGKASLDELKRIGLNVFLPETKCQRYYLPFPDFRTSGQITKNFNVREYRCKGGSACCGGAGPISFELVHYHQKLRDELGIPLTITSGFRCMVHNKRIGGAVNSLHTQGLAGDIALPKGMTVPDFAAVAKEVGIPFVLEYPWGIHTDVRRW
jgi:hypothetical protein